MRKKLADKDFRDAYLDAQVQNVVARQIRVLREQRQWSQVELAQRLNKTQSVVSRLEDPDYGKMTLSTLLELRKVFDVGLRVLFVDAGRSIVENRELSAAALEVEPFHMDDLIEPADVLKGAGRSDMVESASTGRHIFYTGDVRELVDVIQSNVLKHWGASSSKDRSTFVVRHNKPHNYVDMRRAQTNIILSPMRLNEVSLQRGAN